MRLPWLIPFLFSCPTLLAAPRVEKGGRAKALSWQAEECAAFRKHLPDDYVQAFVDVPENWDDAKSEKIKVFYYGRIVPEHGLVAYFNGGPAYSSHAKFRDFLKEQGVADRSLIFIDQRGTGCSTPYPEATAANIPRYGKWMSRAIVKDAEAIRQVLTPGKPWTIFGNSYGGLLVRRYLEVAPDGVARAVSHGFTPTLTKWNYKVRLEAAAATQKEFEKRFPGARDDLKKLRAYFQDHCFETPVRKLCGNEYIAILQVALSYVSDWKEFAAAVHRVTSSSGQAQTDAFRALGNHTLLNDLRPTSEIVWAGTVIGDSEIMPEADECKVAYRDFAGKIGPDDAIFGSCGSTNELWRASVVIPADPVRLDLVRVHLAERPALKFFVFAGALDAIIPAALFREEADLLGPLEAFTVLPDSGHDGYHTERAVNEAAFGPLPNWGKPPPDPPEKPEFRGRY